MANNKFLSVADLDHDKILESLKDYMKNQDVYKDYNFEGSNLSVLLETLAQNAFHFGHYLNVTGSEAFLDSAELRESIISRVKELNYIPRSAVSARAVVNVTIRGTFTQRQIIIPKDYQFRTSLGGKVTTFVTKENIAAEYINGAYVATGATIYEGILNTEYFSVSSVNNEGFTIYNTDFVPRSENIDVSSLEVYVQYPNTELYVPFTRSDSLFGLSGIDNVFFVQGRGSNNYQVVFGDSYFGTGLPDGSTVKIRYRDTLGADGNGLYQFVKTTSIQGYSDISINATTAAYGGASRETNESIKFVAPRFYQTQNRAVIESDFEILIKTNFPEIEVATAYGGEIIKKYGKVILSLKPTGLNTIVPNPLKYRIKQFFATKNMITQIEFVDPDYFYLQIATEVSYNLDLLTSNADTVKAAIATNLNNLNEKMFNKFGADVKASKIETIIDGSDKSITGNNTQFRLIKRLFPETNVQQMTKIEFGNPLYHIPTTTPYPSTTPISVESNLFTVLADNEIDDVYVYFRDNGLGIMNLYIYIPETHTYVLYRANQGTVNYNTGEVNLNYKPKGYFSSLEIKANFSSRDIDVGLSKFVLVDGKDITIDMVVDE